MTVYTTQAFYATLSNTEGQALRTTEGQVHFLTTNTGVWQTLSNADIPALALLGRCDLADVQRLADDVHGLAWIATSRKMEVA